MPTVVDSLIVTLGLDPSNFNKGSKEAARAFLNTREEFRRTGKEVESSAKNADVFLSKLQSRALAMFAVFAGGKGLKDFGDYLNQTNTSVGRAAALYGTTTEKLSSWMGLVQATGGDARGAAASIGSLNNELQQMGLTGDSRILPYLRALGVSIQGTNGQIADATEMLPRLANALGAIHDKARATAIGRGLGLSDDLIFVLSQGPAALKRYEDDQRRWGLITERQTRLSMELTYATAGTTKSFESLGRQVMENLDPSLIKLQNRFTDLFVFAREHGWIESFFAPINAGLDVLDRRLVQAAQRAKAAFHIGEPPAPPTEARKKLLEEQNKANTQQQSQKVAAVSVLEEAFFKALGRENRLDAARGDLKKVLEKDAKTREDVEKERQRADKNNIVALMGPLGRLVDWLTGGEASRTGSGATGTSSPGSYVGGGRSHVIAANAEQLRKDEEFLMSLGRTAKEAAALEAQVVHESSGDAKMRVIDSDGKQHGGLLSWSPERIRNFTGFAGKPFFDDKGNVIASREDQLRFINHEFYGQGPYVDAGAQAAARLAARTDSPGKTAAIFSTMGVRPADTATNERERAATAEDLARKLTDPSRVTQLPLPGTTPNYGAGTAAQWGAPANIQNDNSRSVKIDSINVNVPPGSDGKAVGDGIKKSLADDSMAIHAEGGYL
jgi:hypothetical protein